MDRINKNEEKKMPAILKKIRNCPIGACRWETNRIFHIYTMHLPGTGGQGAAGMDRNDEARM